MPLEDFARLLRRINLDRRGSICPRPLASVKFHQISTRILFFCRKVPGIEMHRIVEECERESSLAGIGCTEYSSVVLQLVANLP